MVKVIIPKSEKIVYKKGRHIRTNWRESPNSSEDKKLIRYYFDVVDDKFREEKIKRVMNLVQKITIINFNFEKVDSFEGRVKGTGLRYLCEIYDSNCSPTLVENAVKKVFGNSVVEDSNLYERSKSGTSLEMYLEKLHS